MYILADRSIWVGGTESHLYNKLEEIVMGKDTKTPFLGCKITKALDKDIVDKEVKGFGKCIYYMNIGDCG